MQLIRGLYAVCAAAFTAAIVILNLRLYAPGAEAYSPHRLGPDVIPQLRFVGQALRAGSGEQMQALFPEGFFFNHVLYGLAWVEVGLREADGSRLRGEALREARWALDRIDSPQGYEQFSPHLDPPHGVFYVGWRSWLAGGVLLLQPPGARDPSEVARFEADCLALAQAFDSSPTPFLQAYTGGAWPVDSVVAQAALRLHDRLLPTRFDSTIQRWLRQAQVRVDPATGLLPHRVAADTGATLDGARGSSQSVIARFLIEVDPLWAREQYALYREQFVAPFLGAPGVLEYPLGASGEGDVDSGPLVNGFSASATVVQIGAAQVHGDTEVVDALLGAGEAVGLPFTLGGTKRYMLGLMPVGDAFLVWAKSSSLWVAKPAAPALPGIVHPLWRWPFHLAAAALAAPAWLPLLVRRRARR